MDQAIGLISDLGFTIASGLIMGYFIFIIIKQLATGLVAEIETVQGITNAYH